MILIIVMTVLMMTVTIMGCTRSKIADSGTGASVCVAEILALIKGFAYVAVPFCCKHATEQNSSSDCKGDYHRS